MQEKDNTIRVYDVAPQACFTPYGAGEVVQVEFAMGPAFYDHSGRYQGCSPYRWVRYGVRLANNPLSIPVPYFFEREVSWPGRFGSDLANVN